MSEAEAKSNQESGTEDGSEEKSGLLLLLDKNLTSYPKLPMLEVIYDRFVRVASNSLRNFTSYNVDVDIDSITSEKFDEHMSAIQSSSMIAVFKAIEWDSYALMTLNGQMIYSFVEILFGGRKIAPNLKVEGRPFTSIEQNIVQSIVEILLNDLGNSFDAVSPVTFQLDRLETNPKFATICRPDDVQNVLKLKVSMDSREGEIWISFPYNTIDPVKKILSKSFLGERGSKDPIWTRHIEREVAHATIPLEITLNGTTSTVKEVLDMKVGQTILLNKGAEDDLDIKICGLKCSKGTLGKIGQSLAIEVKEPIIINRDSL